MKFKTYYSQKENLTEALKEIHSKISLDFDDFDFLLMGLHPFYGVEEVNGAVESVFEGKKYVGFNALNLFSSDEIIRGVVVSVFRFEKNGKVKIFECEKLDSDNFKKTLEYLNSSTEDTHFIIASLADEDFSFFIEKLSKELDYYPVDNIIGGISSGEKIGDELRTFQYVNSKVIKNGFVIVSFENIQTYIDISLGFVPYGITYEITKSKGNRIYEVDNGKSFVEILHRILEGIENPKTEYLWYLPINILDDKDGYVSTLRTVERLEDECVKMFGPVRKHQKFKLSFATKDDLIKEDKKVSKRLAKKLDGIEAAFNFSCVAREYILDDKQDLEVKSYVKNFSSDLFGFFTFGEIGPDKMYKNLKLYNETSLLCIMKEK